MWSVWFVVNFGSQFQPFVYFAVWIADKKKFVSLGVVRAYRL